MRMTATHTTVMEILSMRLRRAAASAVSRPSRALVALVALFLVINAAPSWAGPPFFLVYGVPEGSGAVDPSDFLNGGEIPDIQAVTVEVGAPPVDIDLYLHNWAASNEVSDAPCDPDPDLEVPGADVLGYEVCGWHLVFFANNGLQILAFDDADSGGVTSDLTDDAAGDSVNVTGGTPLTPPAGVAVPIGTITVSASDTNQTLESRPGGAGSIAFVSAALTPQVAPISIVASSLDTCGDNTLDAHEECDDSNTDSGDGCYRNCQDESERSLAGTATAPGDVQVEVEAVNLVIPTVAGETAELVVGNIVDFVNANPSLITLGVSAEQVDTPGERFVTDGSIGATTSNTPGLVFVPEPSRWLMLATGVAFLAAAGRRRFSR